MYLPETKLLRLINFIVTIPSFSPHFLLKQDWFFLLLLLIKCVVGGCELAASFQNFPSEADQRRKKFGRDEGEEI